MRTLEQLPNDASMFTPLQQGKESRIVDGGQNGLLIGSTVCIR